MENKNSPSSKSYESLKLTEFEHLEFVVSYTGIIRNHLQLIEEKETRKVKRKG